MEKRSFLKSLRGKITLHTLAISLVPILVIGGLAYLSLNRSVNSASESLQESETQLSEEVVGANLSSEALLIAQEIDNFWLERIYDVAVWSQQPTILAAAEQGFIRAEEEGLATQSIDALEAAPPSNNSLSIDPTVSAFLVQQVEQSPYFGEIFFTDAHGYNVAVSAATSDFVQSDEDWWQEAWNQEISLGAVEFDDSAGAWSVDISTKISDPRTGNGLGVMKAVLDIASIQEIANLHQSQLQSGSVTILDPEGLLVAETSSEHDLERIMNPEISLLDSGTSVVNAAYATDDASGFELTDESVSGYSRSAGSEFFELIPGFDGFGWAVIVEQPTEVAFAPIASLGELENDLQDSRRAIGLTILVVVVLVAVGALTLSFFLSSSITVPLLNLRDVAEKVSRGDLTASTSVKSDDEIGDLANAFRRMVTAIRFFAAEDEQDPVEV